MTTYLTFIEPIVEAGTAGCPQRLVRDLLLDVAPPDSVEFSDSSVWVAVDSPQVAHQTAVRFLEAAAEYNRRGATAECLVDFRLGASPGKNEAAALFNAQRLSRSGLPGTVTISKELYDLLSPVDQDVYELASAQTQEYCSQRFDLPECFVIMPMDDADTDVGKRREAVYRRYIVPACIKLRARPIRPDAQRGARILSDVIGSLNTGDFVIAYLGAEPWNANTMIEVGYRWATGRPMVLIAEQHLPFDLHDHRSVILDSAAEETPADVDKKVQEIFRHMSMRSEHRGGGELHATATIVIDERESTPDDKRHAISMASPATAELFATPLERLIGMRPADVIERLRDLTGDSAHFDAFSADQSEIYTKLSPATPLNPNAQPEHGAHAKVPIIFRKHPKPGYNMRAFLPIIVSYVRGREASRQNVLYLEVTNAVRRTPEGYVCTLPTPNPMLVFEAYSTGYDRVLSKLPNYQEVLERHLKRIEPRAGMHVLDLGAGTGNLTVALIERGAQVTAVDSNGAMLRQLRAKTSGIDDGLDIVEQDASNLSPWRDGTFDAVSIGLVLFSIMDVQAAESALREAMRVLKPGGVLVVTEPSRDFKMKPLLEETRRYLEANNLLDELRLDWETIVSANESISPEGRPTISAEKVEEICRRAGYRVATKPAYQGHCATVVARKP
jgi:ubiquinone/menaquinone biosynthesis C-methylase UbiE